MALSLARRIVSPSPARPLIIWNRSRPVVSRSPAMTCTRKYFGKYTSRNLPPFSAAECCGQVRQGNDGHRYRAVWERDTYGGSPKCRWKSVEPGSGTAVGGGKK